MTTVAELAEGLPVEALADMEPFAHRKPLGWDEALDAARRAAGCAEQQEARFRALFAPAGGCVHAQGICHCQREPLSERIRAAQDRARIGPLR